MSRSKWKGPYIIRKQLLKNSIKKSTRNSNILPKFINLKINIHNGKSTSDLLILEEMIGHKFGELISTRKTYFFKKK